MSTIVNLEKLTLQVRRDILRMVHSVNSGHPGGSLGCTEFFVVLYNEILNLNSEFNMDGINEDLFFLSNGHISPVFLDTYYDQFHGDLYCFQEDDVHTDVDSLVDSRIWLHYLKMLLRPRRLLKEN